MKKRKKKMRKKVKKERRKEGRLHPFWGFIFRYDATLKAVIWQLLKSEKLSRDWSSERERKKRLLSSKDLPHYLSFCVLTVFKNFFSFLVFLIQCRYYSIAQPVRLTDESNRLSFIHGSPPQHNFFFYCLYTSHRLQDRGECRMEKRTN